MQVRRGKKKLRKKVEEVRDISTTGQAYLLLHRPQRCKR
jgi:hypothetical protein